MANAIFYCSIPSKFLFGTKSVLQEIRETPLIVFINAKAGGKVGPRLATLFARRLGYGQVVRRILFLYFSFMSEQRNTSLSLMKVIARTHVVQ